MLPFDPLFLHLSRLAEHFNLRLEYREGAYFLTPQFEEESSGEDQQSDQDKLPVGE